MIERLFWFGRFGMLALLFLFLWRLAVILARPATGVAAKKPKTVPTVSRESKKALVTFTLRLLQADNKVWKKGLRGEDSVEPGAVVTVQGLLTMGRAPGNDIRLEDPFASAFHARLRIVKQDLFIEDLGTTNGTRVNGIRINNAVRIETGDIVDIGSTSFAVEE